MKNLFLGIIIIGILAAIAGVILMHMSRTDYWKMKVTAEDQRAEAVEARKTAETSAADAQKKQKEAEEKREEAHKVREQAVEEKKQSEERAQTAEKSRSEAEQARQQSENERDQALAAKKIAEQEKAEAEEKQKESEAKSEAADLDRDAAIRSKEEAWAGRQATEKELIVKLAKEQRARSIASFVSGVVMEVLLSIDEAEQLLTRGCDESAKALQNNDLKQRSLAVQIFLRSSRSYETARTKLDKLEKINQEPEQVKIIKEQIQKGIDDYMACVQILSTLIRQMITGTAPTEAEKKEKSEVAIAKKSAADESIVKVCDLLVDLIEQNESAFPETVREQLDKIKKKIDQRTGTSSIEKNTEENMAVLPKNK